MKYIIEFDGDIGTEGTIHYQVADENTPTYTVLELEQRIRLLKSEIERLRGVIDGLKFAIRCDGVSGAEVQE